VTGAGQYCLTELRKLHGTPMLLCNAIWKFGIWMAWFNLPLNIGSKAYCLVHKQSHSGISVTDSPMIMPRVLCSAIIKKRCAHLARRRIDPSAASAFTPAEAVFFS
jgi:hypothetical protein